MSKELSAATFDYSQVDGEVKGKLLCVLRDIRREKAKHQESGMEIGKAVATAHAMLAADGRDGKFSEWVEQECGFSRRSAYNYMNAWQRFGNCASLAQFTQEAMYELAAPSVPEPAVKEALKLADKGVHVNKDCATKILDKFREAGGKPKGKGRTSAPNKPYVDPIEAACEHDYDEEACRKCHAPKPVEQKASEPAVSAAQQTTKQSSDSDESPEVGKLFSTLLEHLRQSVLLLDKINKVVRNDTLREEIFTSLDVANKDILKWRKSAKSRR